MQNGNQSLENPSTLTPQSPSTSETLFANVSHQIQQDKNIASLSPSSSLVEDLEATYNVLKLQVNDENVFESQWVPIFDQVKDLTTSDTNLVSLLLSTGKPLDKFNAAYLISCLVLRSTKKYAAVILLDICAQLITDGHYDQCRNILRFWNVFHLKHPGVPDESRSDLEKHFLVEQVIRKASKIGQHLFAAESLIRFYKQDASLIPRHLVAQTVRMLLIYRPSFSAYNILALKRLGQELPPSLIRLTADEKRKLVKLGIRVQAKGVVPSFANDVYDLALNLPGEKVPVESICTLIRLNIRYNTTSRASRLFHDLRKQSKTVIADMDLETLILIIRHFSQHKKYQDLAREIVEMIPSDMYLSEGLIETLLSYSARVKNEALAMELYQSLEVPVARSVLTALLHLHIAFDDNDGAEKVLAEISRRGDFLRPVEFSMVTGAALKRGNLEKALELIRENPPYVAQMGYGLVMNAAIERSDLKLVDEVLELAIKNLEVGSQECSTISHLIIKKINKFEGCEAARVQYLKWKIMKRDVVAKIQMPNPKIQLVVVRTILDQAIKEQNRSVIRWGLHELRHLGVHLKDIYKEISRRKGLSVDIVTSIFNEKILSE